MKYACENCNLQFDAEDPLNCPRCSSRKIRRSFDKKKFDKPSSVSGTSLPSGASSGSTGSAHVTPASDKPKVLYSSRDISMREGKEGWKEFHSSDIRACLECGGIEFTLNWKHKEKVCAKCGSVYPMPRRSR